MDEYDQEEPNIRFSSACIVILLLHLTAFGGIWAFGQVKAHRAVSPVAAAKTEVVEKAQNQSIEKDAPVAAKAKPEASGSRDRGGAAAEKVEIAVRPGVYTVAKGDNPVTIAHHFGVSYDELLKLNNIEDPKRLQIGQKLKIPAKRTGEQASKLAGQTASSRD